MTDSSGSDIADMLATQEEAIASLYTAFSNALPEMKQFWNNLVIQEKAHGEVLRGLSKLCKSNDAYLNKDKFHPAAIQTNIENMTKQTARVISEGITPVRALSIAADLEHSLIEVGFFQIIESDVPEVKNELAEIIKHTKQHAAIVDQRLNELVTNDAGDTV